MPEHTPSKQPEHTARKAHNLYFAAIPPVEITAQMAYAWQSFGTGASFRHDALHLSLYGIAEMDDLDQMLVQRASLSSRQSADSAIHRVF